MLCQYSSCTAAEKQFSPLLWPKFPVVAQRANCINSTSFDQKKNQPIIFEANYIIYNSYRLILQVITQSFEFIRLAHSTTEKFLSLGGVNCISQPFVTPKNQDKNFIVETGYAKKYSTFFS